MEFDLAYYSKSTRARKRQRYKRNKRMRNTGDLKQQVINVKNWLDDLPCAKEYTIDCCPQECAPVPAQTNSVADKLDKMRAARKTTPKRNEDMHVSQDVNINERTTEAARREYFLERLDETYGNKVFENQKFFGLVDDDRPSSPKGIVDRILAGKYVFLVPTKADAPCYDPLNQIRWRDPAVVADQAGFDAASKKLSDLQTTTTDALWAETDPSKLPALVASFEAVTVH